MAQPTTNSLSIAYATSADMAAALELVFGRLAPDARQLQVAEAVGEIQRSAGDGHIVLIARRQGKPVGAVWAQIQPGQVTSLWPPGLIVGEAEATAATLVDLAVSKSAAAGAKLVQSLLEAKEKSQLLWLRSCGFQQATDLLYLVCPRAKFPTDLTPSELSFEPLSTSSAAGSNVKSDDARTDDTKWARLATIVQKTYEDTQDCPAVQGVRSVDEVLKSYRSVGQFDPARWLIVRHASSGRDIGCLLLTEYREQQNWELVYMGVVPESRGHGWGLQIIRYAQWLAGQRSISSNISTVNVPKTADLVIERLVLAVDVANSPAVTMYLAGGFEVWDRRSVFLRKIE